MAKGNQSGTEQFLISVPLPEQTDTYTVISHQEIIEKVENELNNANLEIINTDYTYSFDGEVALAKVYIRSVVDDDMGMLFTWQNSYNKKVKFSCAIGAYIHDNNASLIGTEGLSWIRKHTGEANDEAYKVIESLIDLADVHFTKVIAEKERMKAMELDTEAYGRVMGALYFEHNLVTPTQASAVKQEREKPVHTYNDRDTLWGLYKLLMYGIENADITKWQQSQQKLHHLIMAEYAIAIEDMGVDQDIDVSQDMKDYHNHPEAPMPILESDIEYQERVATIEGEPEPLTPNELRETEPPTQQEMDEVLEEIVIEEVSTDIEETEVEVEVEEEVISETISNDAEENLATDDLLSKVEEVVEETVEVGDLFGNAEVTEEAVKEEPVVEEIIAEEDEIDFTAIANKYSTEELSEPVSIIPPAKINLPEKEEEVVRSQKPVTVEEAFKEEVEEDFLNIEEHDGLTVPDGMIEDAAVIEKKMILLYGSVRPYTSEESGDQINVIIEETYESFCISK